MENTTGISRRGFLGAAAGTIGAAALVSVAGTGVALADEAATYTPGTYEASAYGIGKVTVTVTFDETSITAIEIDASNETESIGQAAAPTIEEQVLEDQSADIDGVSGATLTSTAVRTAVEDCIAQASGTASEEEAEEVDASELVAQYDGGTATTLDWLGTAPEISDDEIVETLTTDLLIVGAGNAGSIAGAYASDLGMDFILAEKGDSNGTTRHWFNAVGTEPFTSQGYYHDMARMHGEWARYSSGTCDHDLINMWADESNDMFEYVDKHMTANGGVVVADEFEMDGMGATEFYTPCGEHHYTAADGYDSAPDRNDLFESVMNDNGYEISYGYDLAKLVTSDEGAVTGAIFSTADGYVQVNANKAVLLATGGYSANPAMLSALSPITVASVVANGYNGNNTGMGIKAALWAGAVKDITSATMIFDRGIVDNDVVSGYTEESIADGNPIFPSSGQWNPGSQPFLKVNKHGKRFTLESADYDYLPHAAAQQPGGVYAIVFDSNFGDDVQRFGTLGCSAGTRNGVLSYLNDDGTYDLDSYFATYLEDGRLKQCDTLEELAEAMGFEGDDADNFLATCERYNELYDLQEDEDFGKEAYRLSELRNPPYYAAWVGGTLLTTIDGIRINADCQALGADFEPIEGLYCAGDCSGSLFSGNYPDQFHGIACGRAMTEALHVVKLVAEM